MSILELIKANMEMPPGTLIMEDPPVHDIHRQLLARMFSPRRIAELEPKVREYCVRCLDPLVGESRFDLIEKLGLEMPMRVIGMLLGIPEEGQAAFRERVQTPTWSPRTAARLDTSHGAILTFDAFGEYIDWRLTHPSDDVMTELITARFEDENGVTRTLTRDEVLMYVTVLAGAGNETTGRLIGWMGSTLARHPEQRAEIVGRPVADPWRGRGGAAARAARPVHRPLRRPSRWSCTGRSSPRAARCCSSSAPPTATRSGTTTRTGSTSTGRRACT